MNNEQSTSQKVAPAAVAGPSEMHEAMCAALTGGRCTCERNDPAVDKAWARFCGGIGDGPDAPYPGMISAFERYYAQSFTDKDWRREASVWAAAWKQAMLAAAPTTQAAPPQEAQEPVAYAIFAENGNIRLWATEPQHVKRIAAEQGLSLVKLYAAPQAAPVAQGDAEDAERMDWLEQQVRQSHTGVSFDYGRSVDGGLVTEKGYRFMKYHLLCDRMPTLRAAIDAARAHP